VVSSIPCVNKSEYEATYGVDVYLGLMQLEGSESKTAHRIIADRNERENNHLKISSIAFR
jgi:DNA polymerase-3 subunit alpha/error-prone DNA polymerase